MKIFGRDTGNTCLHGGVDDSAPKRLVKCAIEGLVPHDPFHSLGYLGVLHRNELLRLCKDLHRECAQPGFKVQASINDHIFQQI